MSILAPVVSVISRMTLPPEPITSRIFSFGMLNVVIRGAFSLTSSRAPVSALAISPRICRRPSRAWLSAMRMISSVIEVILMSICNAVTPRSVPATLKSISPRWSSSPRMSDNTAKPSGSLMSPIALPATGRGNGTPASIRASEALQTEAIEEEPFDSVTSETTRIVYGKLSLLGSSGWIARQASLPCPISRRPGEPIRPASPVE